MRTGSLNIEVGGRRKGSVKRVMVEVGQRDAIVTAVEDRGRGL